MKVKREGFKRVQELTRRGANAKFEAVLETGEKRQNL